MDQDRDERIKARAHQLWEADGRPHGHDAEHWHRAAEEIDAEGGASSQAFEDAASTPTGADMATDVEASSVVEPTTDSANATH